MLPPSKVVWLPPEKLVWRGGHLHKISSLEFWFVPSHVLLTPWLCRTFCTHPLLDIQEKISILHVIPESHSSKMISLM